MPILWNIIKNIIQGFFCGFKDSLLGFFLVFYYDTPHEDSPIHTPLSESEFLTSIAKERAAKNLKLIKSKNEIYRGKTVKDKVYKSCKINCLVYGSSMLSFHFVILPILNYAKMFVVGDESMWSLYFQPIWDALFQTLWLLPIYLTMKLVNCFWCQDLAYNAYWQRQGKPQANTSIGNFIADLLFTICVQLLFMAQGSIIKLPVSILLPSYFTVIVEYVHFALLNSLYSFEYSWSYMGWSLDRRLRFVEKNWAYFIGFGFIPSIVAIIIPSAIVSGCIFAVIFPFFIISSNEAVPFCEDNGFVLKLFMPAVYITSSLTHFFFKHRTNKTTSNRSFR